MEQKEDAYELLAEAEKDYHITYDEYEALFDEFYSMHYEPLHEFLLLVAQTAHEASGQGTNFKAFYTHCGFTYRFFYDEHTNQPLYKIKRNEDNANVKPFVLSREMERNRPVNDRFVLMPVETFLQIHLNQEDLRKRLQDFTTTFIVAKRKTYQCLMAQMTKEMRQMRRNMEE